MEGSREGRDLGLRLLHQRGEQARERLALLVRVAAAERDQDVEPGRTRGLHVARQLQRLEQLAEGARHLDHVRERRSLGVEIEHQPVRPLERAGAGAPHVDRDGSQVGDVAQRLRVVEDEEADVAIGVLGVDRLGAHPIGHEDRCVLLEERLALDAVRVAREHHGAAAQVGQHERGDGVVVGD